MFEQEDTFNNVTGEATINVPAHGDLTEINIVMQQSTVSTLILLLLHAIAIAIPVLFTVQRVLQKINKEYLMLNIIICYF